MWKIIVSDGKLGTLEADGEGKLGEPWQSPLLAVLRG